ncbi:MAG: phosphoenolpyruvate mutase [Spirochaetes bacterium]|nr:phosphoenolpyruvate mutase [Spirochaetota bacterium]
MNKCQKLRQLITSPELEFICEAHNGISAKIVEEAGFKGIWASGLTLSASLGVRDSNEASWTQLVEILEFMSDATTIPILLDGDTGYGNFNNMRRLVQKLEQRDIAGVCIEDKLFPKTNSFINSEKQPLASIDEFCGKIKAAKDVQHDENFSVIARTEALIAGWGLRESLERAEAYRRAGADAILVHSKKNNPSDIEAFMKEWGDRHPVVIVPTKYYSTPTERFRELGVSLIIWANHLMRSSVKVMTETAQKIAQSESLTAVEDAIAPVSELFRLQGAKELQIAEKKYLPTRGKEYTAVILAASRGEELFEFTRDKPKAMIEINKSPVLSWTIDILNSIEIKNIYVVRGYKKETISGPNFKTIDNDNYTQTKDLYSLYLAKDCLQGNCIVIYGDCLYKKHLFTDLLEGEGDIKIVVDADVTRKSRPQDFVKCTKPYTNDFYSRNIYLDQVLQEDDSERASGEWSGLLAVESASLPVFKETLEQLAQKDGFEGLSVPDLLGALLGKSRVSVMYTRGGWIDIDDIADYGEAGRF